MKVAIENKKVLITGVAGFIGGALSKRLLNEIQGIQIIGIDNMNSYYDVSLKEERLDELNKYSGFHFIKGDIADKETIVRIMSECAPYIVVNLAAQAGVRYSIDHPEKYIASNIMGFFNILEGCRHNSRLKHLVFASSSSIYGDNKKIPYSIQDKADCPVSLYAATKKSDELMAYAYSKLFGIPTTGLRFFTVYGPKGRPDMAYFSFANKLAAGEKIQLFNYGDMYRDFTYIDDIVTGVVNIMQKSPAEDENGTKYKIYNIGNNRPESLTYFVDTLENCLIKEGVIQKRGEREFLPMQPGDVYQTYADISELERDFHFKPSIGLEEGLARFTSWYKTYIKNK